MLQYPHIFTFLHSHIPIPVITYIYSRFASLNYSWDVFFNDLILLLILFFKVKCGQGAGMTQYSYYQYNAGNATSEVECFKKCLGRVICTFLFYFFFFLLLFFFFLFLLFFFLLFLLSSWLGYSYECNACLPYSVFRLALVSSMVVARAAVNLSMY